MTLDEFFGKLYTNMIYEDLIVRLKYKYNHEDKWIYSNEVLEYNSNYGYIWLNDWNEGQQDVVVLGYIPVDEVKVHTQLMKKEDKNNE